MIGAAQRGDQDAFAIVAIDAADRLYAVAIRVLRDPDLARDAVQEALLNAWRDLRSLRDPDRLDPWLYRLVVRACYQEARNRRRMIGLTRLATIRPLAEQPPTVVDDHDQLERGFRRLSPEQRTVVVLRYYLDLPLTDVAADHGHPGRHRPVAAPLRDVRPEGRPRSRRPARRAGGRWAGEGQRMRPDDTERRVREWLAEPPERAPDDLIEFVLAEVPATKRRGPWQPYLPWNLPGARLAGLTAAALAVALLVSLAWSGRLAGPGERGPEAGPGPADRRDPLRPRRDHGCDRRASRACSRPGRSSRTATTRWRSGRRPTASAGPGTPTPACRGIRRPAASPRTGRPRSWPP